MVSSRRDDRQLVEAVLAGEPEAFARLVARHERLVWHLVGRMVRDPEDTRDLCQEVFLRVHQRLPQFRFEAALGTWIGRIAFHLASRSLRRKRLPLVRDSDEIDASVPLLERLPGSADLEAEVLGDQARRHLNSAIDALAPLQRTVVTLYYVDEVSVGEIAAITSLPNGTVKSHLHRARAALRARLEALEGNRR